MFWQDLKFFDPAWWKSHLNILIKKIVIPRLSKKITDMDMLKTKINITSNSLKLNSLDISSVVSWAFWTWRVSPFVKHASESITKESILFSVRIFLLILKIKFKKNSRYFLFQTFWFNCLSLQGFSASQPPGQPAC